MTIFVFASACLIFGLEIHFKQIFSINLTDPYSFIGHLKIDSNLLGRILGLKKFNFNSDYLVLMRKFNCVLYQIYQNLLGSQFINFDLTIT